MAEIAATARPGLGARKEALRFFFEYVVGLLGYKFSPDVTDPDALEVSPPPA